MTTTNTNGAAQTLPHPRFRLPLLGDLATVDFTTPVAGLTREAKRHAEGIFEQRIVNFPVVVVYGATLVDDVNNEQSWEKNVGPSLHKLRSVAGDGLFTAHSHEPNWRKAHNVLTPAFAREAMANYHDSITGTVAEFIDLSLIHI